MEPILTWRPIVPLSRLTYCAFLAHGGLQLYSVASSGNPFYGSVYNLVSYFLSLSALACEKKPRVAKLRIVQPVLLPLMTNSFFFYCAPFKDSAIK